MIIYKVTNIIEGKNYIGQTINSMNERKKDHINKALNQNSQTEFHKSLRKYGTHCFVWIEIDSAQSIDELNKKEQFWIKFYNTIAPNGYNLMMGGFNKKMHQSSKIKMSQALRKHLWVKVYKYNLDLKLQCVFENIKEMKEKENIIYVPYKTKRNDFNCFERNGFIYSLDNDIKKITDFAKEIKRKLIVHFDKTGKQIQVFKNVYQAATALNIVDPVIYSICEGKTKRMMNDEFFLYFENVNEKNIKERINFERYAQKKKVAQKKLNGELIKIFDTVKEASEHSKVQQQNICKVCKGKRKQAGGFIWEYI